MRSKNGSWQMGTEMTNLFLVGKIAKSGFAITSDAVESVVNITDFVPAPKSSSKVVGLSALRSRVLTLIDCEYLLTGKAMALDSKMLAIVAELGGIGYGFLVQSISDVTGATKLGHDTGISADSKWQPYVDGFVRQGEEILPILKLESFVGG
jgi:purine-binding chemotaxis protein CheW